MRYCPYLCSPSALSLYLSTGFTMAALSLPWASRGAYCAQVRHSIHPKLGRTAHPHVWRVFALAGDLFCPQCRRSKGAHGISRTARRARGDGAQWPGDSKPQSHCVSGECGGTARCSRRGATLCDDIVDVVHQHLSNPSAAVCASYITCPCPPARHI